MNTVKASAPEDTLGYPFYRLQNLHDKGTKRIASSILSEPKAIQMEGLAVSPDLPGRDCPNISIV